MLRHLGVSPSLRQSVVTEVEDELMEGVRLDLSHLLFLLLHNLHWGFLQGFQRSEQLALSKPHPLTIHPTAALIHQHFFFFFLSPQTYFH